jgi:PPOX class probable F420-dependent enzyme
MDVERAREFIRRNPRAVMATFAADGRPLLTPVLVTVAADGMAVVSTRETAVKTANLRRDPRTVLCVMNDGFFGDWVQVEGRAQVVPLPDAMEPLVDYYRRISGEHPDWDDYRAAMRAERRVLVRVAITRAGPDIGG